jgi:hypothetical protein
MNRIYFEDKTKDNALNKEQKTIDEKANLPIPIIIPEEKSSTYSDIKLKKYRKGQKEHILYTRIYLLFFFVGACVFASGKWGSENLAEKTVSFLLSEINGFSDFCLKYAPVVFGSFLVYASGFTVYAPLLSVVYSALTFLFFGVSSGSIVFLYGAGLNSALSIALPGLICVACIIFCAVTAGISKIASMGIDKLRILDGLLYTALYWGYIFCWYCIIKGMIFFLAL